MISEIRANTMMPIHSTPSTAPAAAATPEASVQAPTDGAEFRPQTKLEKLLETTAPQAASLAENMEDHVEGQVIVKTKASIMKSTSNFAQRYGAQVLEKFDFGHDVFKSMGGELLQIKLPEGMTTAQAMAAMQQDPSVEYVVPNTVYTLDDPETPAEPANGNSASKAEGKVPNDLKSELWGLNNDGQKNGTVDCDIDAPEAWQKTIGVNNGPIIAVIDTGVDYNHPDLVNNIWTNPGEIAGDGIDNDGNGVIDDVHGYNAFADSGDPMDKHSHGTHCAGTIAAEGNNNQGVVGVNWKATVMPVKIFGDDGRTNAAAILRGINYAAKNGARITSNSWGGGAANQAIQDAFRNTSPLHIMAAGNSGANNDLDPHYPSSYDLNNNIAVAATDRNDKLAYFSCYGKNSVDIAAPGVEIYSTVPGGGYGFKSGTSMATPHVSGAAGLLLAQDPTMSNDEIKTRLLQGADKVAGLEDKVATGARLNINNALEYNYTPGGTQKA